MSISPQRLSLWLRTRTRTENDFLRKHIPKKDLDDLVSSINEVLP